MLNKWGAKNPREVWEKRLADFIAEKERQAAINIKVQQAARLAKIAKQKRADEIKKRETEKSKKDAEKREKVAEKKRKETAKEEHLDLAKRYIYISIFIFKKHFSFRNDAIIQNTNFFRKAIQSFNSPPEVQGTALDSPQEVQGTVLVDSQPKPKRTFAFRFTDLYDDDDDEVEEEPPRAPKKIKLNSSHHLPPPRPQLSTHRKVVTNTARHGIQKKMAYIPNVQPVIRSLPRSIPRTVPVPSEEKRKAIAENQEMKKLILMKRKETIQTNDVDAAPSIRKPTHARQPTNERKFSLSAYFPSIFFSSSCSSGSRSAYNSRKRLANVG